MRTVLLRRSGGLLTAAVLVLGLLAPAAQATPMCTDGYEGGLPLVACGGRVFPEAEHSVANMFIIPLGSTPPPAPHAFYSCPPQRLPVYLPATRPARAQHVTPTPASHVLTLTPTLTRTPTAVMCGAPVSWNTFFLKNLLPVTLGNIIGGAFFVAAALSYTYGRLGK